jgi:hypothetical protein
LVGAIAATTLERWHRQRERISREVGECSKLLFIVGRMLWMLEDLDDSFIGGQRKKLNREPTWEEVGALPGAPTECPAIIIGEYTFLLEDGDPSSMTPEMLSRAYTAEATVKVILARLSERSMHWHQYRQELESNRFTRGADAMRGMGTSGAIAARIKELTHWLDEDIPASIASIKRLLPELLAVLAKRYPGHSPAPNRSNTVHTALAFAERRPAVANPLRGRRESLLMPSCRRSEFGVHRGNAALAQCRRGLSTHDAARAVVERGWAIAWAV